MKKSFDPGINFFSLDKPFPMASISSTVDILMECAFKAVDDIKSFLPQLSKRKISKTQGLKKGGHFDRGNWVQKDVIFSGAIRWPMIGKNMDLMAFLGQFLHQPA